MKGSCAEESKRRQQQGDCSPVQLCWGEWGRRRHHPSSQGAVKGDGGETKGACSQETGRLQVLREESWDARHSPGPSAITPSLLTLSLSSRSVNNFLMTGPKVREIPLISVPDSTKPREGGAPPSHSSPSSLSQSSPHPQVSSTKAERSQKYLL